MDSIIIYYFKSKYFYLATDNVITLYVGVLLYFDYRL